MGLVDEDGFVDEDDSLRVVNRKDLYQLIETVSVRYENRPLT